MASFKLIPIFIVLAATACPSVPGDTPPRHVLLITSCTTRWDVMGFNGHDGGLTPHLDAFARDAVVFGNAISQAPWTKPSVSSILTGLTPNVHKVDDYYSGRLIAKEDFQPNRILSDKAYTIAEFFADHEYATAANIANGHASAVFNLDQGFDEYTWPKGDNRGSSFAQRATKALTAHKDRRLFLFHLPMDAHGYDPPFEQYAEVVRRRDGGGSRPTDQELRRGYDRRKKLHKQALTAHETLTGDEWENLRNLYDAEILYLDQALGTIFASMKDLGIYEEAVIVFSADHGEAFNEHKFFAHQRLLYDTVVRVPLVIKAPRTPAGRVEAQVRNIDIYPTLVDLAGGRVSDYPFMGESLLPLMYGEKQGSRPAISSDSRIGDALRFGSFKLIKGRTETKLFELQRDPMELDDAVRRLSSKVEELEWQLEEILDKERNLSRTYGATSSITLDDEMREELESLGYIK